MGKKFFLSALLTLSVVMGFTGVRAEIEKIITTVNGMFCPKCPFSLGKHINEIEDITIDSIDLKTGDVTFFPKKNLLATPKDLKKMINDFKTATKKAGFTLGEKIRVLAQGKVVEVKTGQNRFRLWLNKTHKMILYKVTDLYKKILRDAIKQRKMVEVEGEIREGKNKFFRLFVNKVRILETRLNFWTRLKKLFHRNASR